VQVPCIIRNQVIEDNASFNLLPLQDVQATLPKGNIKHLSFMNVTVTMFNKDRRKAKFNLSKIYIFNKLNLS
jgi:hypothetical protein